MKITAATFNMQNGQGWCGEAPDAGPVDIDATADFLASLDADVLFLQEVERGLEGGHQEQPPPNFSRLRTLLPGYSAYFEYPPPNPEELPFGLGLAIFSRQRLEARKSEALPAADLEFEFEGTSRHPSQRLLIEARCDFEGRTVRLMNTHLQAYFMLDTTGKAHPEQRDAVLHALSRSGIPTLLGGDFNCEPGDHLPETFAAAGFQPVQTTQTTWRRQPLVLDHLFYSRNLVPRAVQVIPTRCSDHHAVKAEFQLP